MYLGRRLERKGTRKEKKSGTNFKKVRTQPISIWDLEGDKVDKKDLENTGNFGRLSIHERICGTVLNKFLRNWRKYHRSTDLSSSVFAVSSWDSF